MQVTCQRCGWQGENAQYCSRCGAHLGQLQTASPSPFPPPSVVSPALAPGSFLVTTAERPAGFWIRYATLQSIDSAVLILAHGGLVGVGWLVSGGSPVAGMVVQAAVLFGTFLVSAAYFIFFHWAWGQTLGKMALQIKVVSMDGGPLSPGQAVGRYLATYLSALILGIGFIMAGIRSDKRALHDLLAGTRVVRL
jgi:uncharacterized RDD family membrane protein YckC